MTSSDRLRGMRNARVRKEQAMLARVGWSSADKLTKAEEGELQGCEEVIENGLKIWYQVGEALLHIRDKRLYRAQYSTFEEYCQERWGMGHRHANRLIAASEVVASLGPMGPKSPDSGIASPVGDISSVTSGNTLAHEEPFPLPTNERQARELAAAPAPLRPVIWRLAVKTAKDGNPTAEHIKSTRNVVTISVHTGAIDDGEGNDIPLDSASLDHYRIAINEDTYERDARRSAHIAEKQEKKAAQERKRIDLIQRADLPDAKFRVVYADPPWMYGNTMPEYVVDQEDHYSLMTLAQICAMPVKDIVEDNAVLFLWVTSPILEESFQVIAAWGFKYKASFVWDKIKHNMGHYNSVRHEFLLIATRGSCQPDERTLFDSVQESERTAHSEKPEGFRKIIDTLYPHGKRVELFARKQVEGWECFGNEIPAVQQQLKR